MGRLPRIVAWANAQELLAVRDLFYPAQSAKDERHRAVQIVKAWQIRTRLPHSIESTAQLTDALLHDSSSSTSQLISQLAYSTSICRFVNGLLDPAQNGNFAQSMHELAQNMGLPASFVEIRHAATHEVMPSLVVLRKACERALDWLWENYWTKVDIRENLMEDGIGGLEMSDGVGQEDVDMEAKKKAIRDLLKRWRRLGVSKQRSMVDKMEATSIVGKCTAVFVEPDGLDNFVDVLLEEKALIPAGESKRENMPGALQLWSPLLAELQKSIAGLLPQLVNTMLFCFKVGQDETVPLDDEEYLDAIYMWLEHLVSDQDTTVDLDDLVRRCLVEPNEWNLRLVNCILAKSSTLKGKYKNLLALAKQNINSASSGISGIPSGTMDGWNEAEQSLQNLPKPVSANNDTRLRKEDKTGEHVP